jgi:hypothetical protein
MAIVLLPLRKSPRLTGRHDVRKTLVFFALLLAPIAASSQVTCESEFEGPSKAVPGSPAPIFTLKEPFRHLAALPDHVLALLRTDKDNTEKFQACRSRQGLAEIPPKWFLATEVRLVNGELPGLVVKAANACLWGKKQDQEVGGFWVFRQAPTGYQLVFTEQTQALQVLNSNTASYSDLCTSWGSYSTCYRTIYTFTEGKYVPFTYSQREVDFFPPPPPR